MTPTFPDNWRQDSGFMPIQNPQERKRDRLEEIKNRICQHLERRGIYNEQVKYELIKIIVEEDEFLGN